MATSAEHPWLLLIHQIPHKPDYLRVKVRRRLQKVGAVASRGAVYMLPATDASLEDFQWIAREIRSAGGEASICAAGFIEGVTDQEIRAIFSAERDSDYLSIEEAALALGRSLPARKAPRDEDRARIGKEIVRLRRLIAETARIDFFAAPGRAKAEAAIMVLERRLSDDGGTAPAAQSPPAPIEVRGGIWVTRKGIHVDRIASAWLIRRYIDPEARFKFVEQQTHKPAKGELRFDMFEGEFTHEGDACTFETLVRRFGVKDEAVHALARIVHDIDLKDEKFGREETAGVAALIDGLCRTSAKDEDRLERGMILMDGLHASLGGAQTSDPRKRKPRK